MTRRQALEHAIWQEENLQLWKPTLFNRRKLNKFKRELHELDHPPQPAAMETQVVQSEKAPQAQTGTRGT